MRHLYLQSIPKRELLKSVSPEAKRNILRRMAIQLIKYDRSAPQLHLEGKIHQVKPEGNHHE